MKEKTILLIEDNPSDIGLTRRAFERGHILNQLVTVEDGQEALDYLFGAGRFADRDLSDAPAVILLDLKLPKVDGLAVLRRIRSEPRTKLIPVVVLTTSREEEDMIQSYHLGANSYIRKPVDSDQFAEAVRQLGLYWLLLNETAPLTNAPKSP